MAGLFSCPAADVARALRALRFRAQLSHFTASKQAGCSARAIQRYEGGTRCPTVQVLVRLLAAYSVTWADFWLVVNGRGPQARLSQRRLPMLEAADYLGLLRSQGIDCHMYKLDSGDALVVAAILEDKRDASPQAASAG